MGKYFMRRAAQMLLIMLTVSLLLFAIFDSDQMRKKVAVAELGSGSGKKTRQVLEALCRRQRTAYYPIEISPSALAMCERELRDIESISILGFERS